VCVVCVFMCVCVCLCVRSIHLSIYLYIYRDVCVCVCVCVCFIYLGVEVKSELAVAGNLLVNDHLFLALGLIFELQAHVILQQVIVVKVAKVRALGPVNLSICICICMYMYMYMYVYVYVFMYTHTHTRTTHTHTHARTHHTHTHTHLREQQDIGDFLEVIATLGQLFVDFRRVHTRKHFKRQRPSRVTL